MLAWIASHQVLLTLFAVLTVAVIVAPLARAKTLALRAYRARQSADAKGASALAVGASLDALTALAATLVLSVEGEVRDLKDPTKPGAWNPATDGPRFLGRVVGDLWALGGDSVRQLRELQGLSVEAATQLLERIAEAQVQKLRASAPPVVELVGRTAARETLPGPAPSAPSAR